MAAHLLQRALAERAEGATEGLPTNVVLVVGEG